MRSDRRRRYRLKLFGGAEAAPCCFCGTALTMETATLEHVIPSAHGGRDHFKNMALSCLPCNRARGTLGCDRFRARIIAKLPPREKVMPHESIVIKREFGDTKQERTSDERP